MIIGLTSLEVTRFGRRPGAAGHLHRERSLFFLFGFFGSELHGSANYSRFGPLEFFGDDAPTDPAGAKLQQLLFILNRPRPSFRLNYHPSLGPSAASNNKAADHSRSAALRVAIDPN
jgi:hypothetical protein